MYIFSNCTSYFAIDSSNSLSLSVTVMLIRAEEQSQQLQLVEREDIEDEDDLFEAIDKRKFQRFKLINCVVVLLFKELSRRACVVKLKQNLISRCFYLSDLLVVLGV